MTDPFKPNSSYYGFVKSKIVLYNPYSSQVRVSLSKNETTIEDETQKIKNSTETKKVQKSSKKVHFEVQNNEI